VVVSLLGVIVLSIKGSYGAAAVCLVVGALSFADFMSRYRRLNER
jgi:drug/metabolite transporter (DMT)-like permease